MNTWTTTDTTDVACSKCGRVYSVRGWELPTRDKDQFNCEVCGELLAKWNSTHAKEFRLKFKGSITGTPAA